MDGGGVLYETTDPFDIARLMDAVLDDSTLEEAVLASQDAALERLRARDFGGTLLRFVGDLLQQPPAPAPEVAWDFWAQYEQFERLEELRQFRPALFKALPDDPDGARDAALGVRENGDRVPATERRAPGAERRE
jgi:hypothetical protein